MDHFVRTTRKSWFSRIMSSFFAVLIGIGMFFGSFVLLFFGEGRVNLSKIAKTAILLDANESASADAEGQLVAISGELSTEEEIGDEYLKAGNYLVIEREVEMYAWRESSSTKTRKNIGGSETTRKTYTYSKTWQSNPEKTSDFEEPSGHINPPMEINAKIIQPSTAKIGNYELDAQNIKMPKAEYLSLSASVVDIGGNISVANSDYLFMGMGRLNSPEVGDLRIRYKVLKNPVKTATVLGQLNNSSIGPFKGPKESTLHRAFHGTHKDAVKVLRKEHNTTTWIIRGIGFGLMWIGMMLIFSPLSTFLDIIPLAGNITRNLVAMASFGVSVVLTSVTIIVSMLLHNIWLMIGIVAAVAIGMIVLAKMRKRAKDRV